MKKKFPNILKESSIDKNTTYDTVILNAKDYEDTPASVNAVAKKLKDILYGLPSNKIHLSMGELYVNNESLGIGNIIFHLFNSLGKDTKHVSIIGNDTHTKITIPLFEKCVETVGFAFKRGFHPHSMSFCSLSTFSIVEGISQGIQFDNMHNLSKINIDYCSVRLSEFFSLSKNLQQTQIKTFNFSNVELYTDKIRQAALCLKSFKQNPDNTIDAKVEDATGDVVDFTEFQKDDFLVLKESISNIFSIKSLDNICMVNLDIKDCPPAGTTAPEITIEEINEINTDLSNNISKILKDRNTTKDDVGSTLNSLTIGIATCASQLESSHKERKLALKDLYQIIYQGTRDNLFVNQININIELLSRIFEDEKYFNYKQQDVNVINETVQIEKDTLHDLTQNENIKKIGFISTNEYSANQTIEILPADLTKFTKLELGISNSVDSFNEILEKINNSGIPNGSFELITKDLYEISDEERCQSITRSIFQSNKISTLTIGTKEIESCIINLENDIKKASNLSKLTIYDYSEFNKNDIDDVMEKAKLDKSNEIIRDLMQFPNLKKVQFIGRNDSDLMNTVTISSFMYKFLKSTSEINVEKLYEGGDDCGNCIFNVESGFDLGFAIEMYSEGFRCKSVDKAIEISFCFSSVC